MGRDLEAHQSSLYDEKPKQSVIKRLFRLARSASGTKSTFFEHHISNLKSEGAVKKSISAGFQKTPKTMSIKKWVRVENRSSGQFSRSSRNGVDEPLFSLPDSSLKYSPSEESIHSGLRSSKLVKSKTKPSCRDAIEILPLKDSCATKPPSSLFSTAELSGRSKIFKIVFGGRESQCNSETTSTCASSASDLPSLTHQKTESLKNSFLLTNAKQDNDNRLKLLALHKKAASTNLLLGPTSEKKQGHSYFFGQMNTDNNSRNTRLGFARTEECISLKHRAKTLLRPRTPCKSTCEQTRAPPISRRHSSHAVKETKTISTSTDILNDRLENIRNRLEISSLEGMINQYAIIRNIGEGSFSQVYLVYNTEDEKYYACKAVNKKRLRRKNLWKSGPPRKKNDEFSETNHNDIKVVDYMDFVRREIAIMKKISRHPHIVTLIEVLDDEKYDTLYMIFELCEFGSVMTLQPNQVSTRLPEDLARRYFRGIVLGLEYLHHLKIIHRDIKPENILINSSNHAVIGDFSISYCTSDNNAQITKGNWQMTPMFTPPELIRNNSTHNSLAEKFDIWCLGLTLFCLTHGTVPFNTNDIEDLYDQILSKPIKVDSKLSRNLFNLLHQMLHRDPEKRMNIVDIKKHPWTTDDGNYQMATFEQNCVELLGLGNCCSTFPTAEDLQTAVKPAISIWQKLRGTLRKKRSETPGESCNKT